jgi:hypothetical protein
MAKVVSRESDWKRLGAKVRLQEIQAEAAEIYAAFPELRRGHAATGPEVARVNPRRGRKLPEDMRKRMAAGMRRYWAKRKAEAAKAARAKD